MSYQEDNNPGFPSDAPQHTDFRWRKLAVSLDMLNSMVRGGIIPGTGAPADLTVLTVDMVTHGGWWILLVWSATFAPVPNDGTHRLEEVPLTGPEWGWV